MDNKTIINGDTRIDVFEMEVTKSGEKVTEEFELFYNESADLYGLLLASDREDLVFYRGTLEVLLSGNEIIPENYDAKLLMSGLNVPPGERFQYTEFFVGNGKLEVRYQDTEHPKAPFQPYKLKIYAWLNRQETT